MAARSRFVHGVTRRWQDFAAVAGAFSARWQPHALDFRGHGRSGRTPGRYCVVDYVRDAVGFVRAQLDEPTIVWGHSLGALVAAALAAELPGSVRAAVLEDPPAPRLLGRLRSTPFFALFSAMRGLASERLNVREAARRLAALHLPAGDPETSVRLGDER
jgi:pimeloyl-ACP methyl ester carboxylesterase